MSVRKQSTKTQTLELKIVLVEKSFSEPNGPVALTLVTVIAQSSEKIASVKATLRRFSMRTVLSLYHGGVRCSAKKTVDYYHSLGPGSLWQARLMQEIPSGQPKTAIDISNDGKQTVLMVCLTPYLTDDFNPGSIFDVNFIFSRYFISSFSSPTRTPKSFNQQMQSE